MFTINGHFNNGDEWQDTAEDIQELIWELEKLCHNGTVSDYVILDDDVEKSLEDIAYDHAKELEDYIHDSEDPESAENQIVDLFQYNPWA